MAQPTDMSQFTASPLGEIVLGVQYSAVPNYKTVHSMKIWDMFRDKYPKLQEHPVIDPQVEVFGPESQQAQQPRIRLGSGTAGARLWFVNDDESRLLQFQPDRFVANWRREFDAHPDPGFDELTGEFRSYLDLLSAHFAEDFGYTMDINQAEVSFYNFVPVHSFADVRQWFNCCNTGEIDAEAFNYGFNEVILDNTGLPCARMNHLLQTLLADDGVQKVVKLSLTLQGKPMSTTIDSAMEFLASGRKAVVDRFQQLATEQTLSVWKK